MGPSLFVWIVLITLLACIGGLVLLIFMIKFMPGMKLKALGAFISFLVLGVGVAGVYLLMNLKEIRQYLIKELNDMY